MKQNKKSLKTLGVTFGIVICLTILALLNIEQEVSASSDPTDWWFQTSELRSDIYADTGNGFQHVCEALPGWTLYDYHVTVVCPINGTHYLIDLYDPSNGNYRYTVRSHGYKYNGRTYQEAPHSEPRPTNTPNVPIPDHDLSKWVVYHNETTGDFWYNYPGRDIIRSNQYENLFHVVHGESYVFFQYDKTWGIPIVLLLDGGYNETGIETTVTIQVTCMSGPQMNDNSLCSGPTPTPEITDPTPTIEPTPGPTATPEPTPTATAVPRYGNWTVLKNKNGDPVFRYGPLGGYSTSLPWRGGLKAVVLDGAHWFLYVYQDVNNQYWWSISAKGSSQVYEGLISELP